MPTVAIEATTMPPPLRRRVAHDLTRWFAARGVPSGHVVTRFRIISESDVFAGAVPLSWALSGHLGGSCAFAFVTCTVSADRDRTFHQELADQVIQALHPEIPLSAVFVAIHPVDPANHFRGGTRPPSDRMEEVSP